RTISRAAAGEPLCPAGAAFHGTDRNGRRGLLARIDPPPSSQDRRRLPADHADLRGADRRRGHRAADCLHQVARPAGGGQKMNLPDTPALPHPNYLNVDYSVRSWLLTTDHKRIAILYLWGITLFFFVGGTAAVLFRLELMTPEGDLV